LRTSSSPTIISVLLPPSSEIEVGRPTGVAGLPLLSKLRVGGVSWPASKLSASCVAIFSWKDFGVASSSFLLVAWFPSVALSHAPSPAHP